jgi:hypothetical protein
MQTSITLTTNHTYTITSTQVDISGTPLKTPDGSYGAPTFVCSDTSIATVNSGGVVTPVAPGSCVVTATETAQGKANIVGTLLVTVVLPTAASLDLTGTIGTLS